MTEIKLFLFLKKCVIKRELKRRDRKSGAAAEINLQKQRLSSDSIRSYVLVIIDL